MNPSILPLTLAALLAASIPSLAAAKAQTLTIPDFTRGDTIPAGAKHDWNLGATGARGWMFCDSMVTTDARQIVVTKVETSSPADGILAVGDVLLGVGGKPFSYDPRTELGKELSTAESDAAAGKLALTRWRAGKKEDGVIMLPALGDYSATAPYACLKSKRILEQGCKLLAAEMAEPAYANKHDPIPRSLNALALLASGDPAYLPLVKKEAQWAADFSAGSFQTWYYGYVMLLLSEYVIATGDVSVMPGLKRLALASARGQSAVGSWGHGFAIPDGRLGGYGMMNSPGVPLTIALALARTAGVKDAAVDRAIERSARLLRFYIGKGAIPYGDHAPWTETHEDNGKCGMTAVLFDLLCEEKGAEFFSRMSVASHGPERDTGHTGNFFNMLWAMPGVAQSDTPIRILQTRGEPDTAERLALAGCQHDLHPLERDGHGSIQRLAEDRTRRRQYCLARLTNHVLPLVPQPLPLCIELLVRTSLSLRLIYHETQLGASDPHLLQPLYIILCPVKSTY